jgi:opacity protein-like surface antigen
MSARTLSSGWSRLDRVGAGWIGLEQVGSGSRILAAVLLAFALLGGSAVAQVSTVPADQTTAVSTVETTREKVIVWRRNPSQVLATLPKGLRLEAVAQEGQWYVVRVPEKYAGPGGATGYVYQGHVALVEGPPPPKRAPVEPRASDMRGTRRPAAPTPALGFRGYGTVSYDWFEASKSFDAILGQKNGVFYGGGGQVLFHRLFVDVSFEHFKKTGERVFVSNNDVFPLGIDDTITIDPLRVVGGYRFPSANGITGYVGGGIGSVHFQETSEFADANENTDERFTSYHVVGGVEYAAWKKWLFVAAEFHYSSVPDALGAPGVSADFDESNLGGVGIAVKVMVGK